MGLSRGTSSLKIRNTKLATDFPSQEIFNFRMPRDGLFPPRHRIDPVRMLTAFMLDATAMTAQVALQGIPFHPLTSMSFSHAQKGLLCVPPRG